MIPTATSAPPTVFRLFQDEHSHWCVRTDDSMTGGTFFTREGALRFVRRETVGIPAPGLHGTAEMHGPHER